MLSSLSGNTISLFIIINIQVRFCSLHFSICNVCFLFMSGKNIYVCDMQPIRKQYIAMNFPTILIYFISYILLICFHLRLALKRRACCSTPISLLIFSQHKWQHIPSRLESKHRGVC